MSRPPPCRAGMPAARPSTGGPTRTAGADTHSKRMNTSDARCIVLESVSRTAAVPGHNIGRFPVAASEGERLHFRGDVLGRYRCGYPFQVRLLAPQLELVAEPAQDGTLLDAGGQPQAMWQQQAGLAVGLDVAGRADQLPLQFAMGGVEARQGVDLVAHALPFAEREQPQAMRIERVVGEHR